MESVVNLRRTNDPIVWLKTMKSQVQVAQGLSLTEAYLLRQAYRDLALPLHYWEQGFDLPAPFIYQRTSHTRAHSSLQTSLPMTDRMLHPRLLLGNMGGIMRNLFN